MTTRYESGEKFLRVVQLLQRLNETEKGLTTAQLAEELEVTPRSVQRYIATLRDSAGIDIIETDGRFRVGDHSRLPALQLDRYQATSILIALRLLYKMRTDSDPAMVGALAQLARALRVPVVTRLLQRTIGAAEQRPDSGDRRRVERALVDGFVDHQTVAIEYRDKDQRHTSRSIQPYFLEPRPEGRTVYVFAHDAQSNEVRSFRLDRIQDARVVGPAFTVPESFDIDGLLGTAWSIWHGDPVVDVRIRFAAAVADRVAEQTRHTDATLIPGDDGGVEMRIAVASEVEMRPWVLGWGDAAEVLAPPSLRQHVAEAMRRGAAQYATESSKTH